MTAALRFMLAHRLREAIQNAADQASASTSSSHTSAAADRDRGPSAKHLKPIVTAVEMVFGSAAALSATFGFKDKIGIDVELLDEMQRYVDESRIGSSCVLPCCALSCVCV